ncbi:MAG: DUF2461 domain-containing protein [Anaerolineales bacterium]|nr:DUF2461 domain-containing protein [Anaerolineales bacterium]
MDLLPEFPGFPIETWQFLEKLAENNHREWFNAHKDDYQRFYMAPAQDFVFALGERLKSISSNLVVDPATNGSGSLFRIYRDIRFSKDKTPYNTDLCFYFWEGIGKKFDNPGYYIQLEPKGGRTYAGHYIFPKTLLSVFRDAVIDEKLGGELEDTLKGISQAGSFNIGGSHYKRVPRGYDADNPRAKLLKFNGLYIIGEHIDRETLSHPELVEQVFEQCRKMAPLQEWLVKINSSQDL